MSSADESARDFVTENRQLLEDVLRYSQDPYARACALVLLKHGGTGREIDEIREDLAAVDEQGER